MPTNDAIIEAIPSSVIDYESLRLQGIAWLEKIAGSEWTDFNAHDPGITILEQVCYALTDLSYRIDYDMEDLLSREGEDSYESLYLPKQILVTKPVTLLDMRKLAIDVAGVNNAWFEPVIEPEPPFFYVEKPIFETVDKAVNLTGGESATALTLQGLYRVWLETSSIISDSDKNALERKVSERLHDQRSLAVDFAAIQVIDSQFIQLQAAIEIDLSANPEDVYIAILEKIAAYLSPSVRFYTFEECLAQGMSIVEIFDGPLLDHGFIDNRELLRFTRKNNLYASDLIREIMDVSGVRLVEYVAFNKDGKLNDTGILVEANQTPKLDVYKSNLTLKKRQLPIPLDIGKLNNRYFNQQQNTVPPLVNSSLPVPQGRDRHLANYYSLLQQFPKVYGIGETGLPGNASEQRIAQAKQLKAYLLFFDQLLANSFTQLAHVRDLFSFHTEQPDSYFAACLGDPGISDLWVEQNNDSRRQSLQKIFGSCVPGLTDQPQPAGWQRKSLFIDHLLARFAEQFADYSHFDKPDDAGKAVVLSKLALLRCYDLISCSKGTGINILACLSTENRSGLEQMLRLKLGVLETEKLYVLEHALFRPMTGDSLQQAPLLCSAFRPDPYSLQLSVAYFASANRSDGFKRFVEQTVRDETPAHLIVYVSWFDLERADVFDAAYQDWQLKHRDYRMLSDQRILNGPTAQSAAIPLRDARDRLIDWLGIGQTYPLRDLAVPDPNMVAYNTNMQATIVISNSQQGVSYRLCDDRQNPLNPDIIKEGNGGDLKLTTPIVNTRIFSIKATKLSNNLTVMLLQTPIVTVGLDLNLNAAIKSGTPLLNTDTPVATDARIVDYGVKVSVDIGSTQQGVGYRLVKIDDKANIAFLSDEFPGTSETITLVTTEGASEDVDFRIQATNKLVAIGNKDPETGLLTAVLPLKVRANPTLSISMLNAIIDYSSAASLTIASSQANVRYQALIRSIADHEFIHGAADVPFLTVPVPEKETVKLRTPTITGDFALVSESVQGVGGDLQLSIITKLTEDSFIAIKAIKTHKANNGETVESMVYLSEESAILVRPDANPAIHFKAILTGSVLQAPVQVSGGQAGVFYEFSTDNKVQGLPVYFQQRDRDDKTQNKGIGQLQVEVDLVITPSLLAERLAGNPNIAGLPPEPPELSANVALNNTDELSIRAYKAQSGVEVIFKHTVAQLLA